MHAHVADRALYESLDVEEECGAHKSGFLELLLVMAGLLSLSSTSHHLIWEKLLLVETLPAAVVSVRGQKEQNSKTSILDIGRVVPCSW